MSGRRPSIANEMRREQIQEELAMSPADRVRIARSLFERHLAILMAAQKLSREDALREIERSRQSGRRRSRCMQG